MSGGIAPIDWCDRLPFGEENRNMGTIDGRQVGDAVFLYKEHMLRIVSSPPSVNV